MTFRHIRHSRLTGTPLSLAIFCDSYWFQKLETTGERTGKLWLRMNSDWFQSAPKPKSWLNTPLVTLSSSKWCLVAPVKSQQFVKKEKEKERCNALQVQGYIFTEKNIFCRSILIDHPKKVYHVSGTRSSFRNMWVTLEISWRKTGAQNTLDFTRILFTSVIIAS